MKQILLEGISTLVTMAPLANEARVHSVAQSDLGIVHNAWLAIEAGRVVAVGAGKADGKYSQWARKTLIGKLVVPGLVDAHTHPIFAGSRANEFCMRLNGATYQEIAAAGGGIKSSVTSTRNASNEELLNLLQIRLKKFLRYGVTTVEVKSGYGLNSAEELRMLRILTQSRQLSRQTLSITCLALHAVMPEFKSARAWADTAVKEILPVVAKEKLADAVDAFVEQGYFSPDDVREYLKTAKQLGLAIRLHADEFLDSGAADLAAESGALSADHLQHASAKGVAKMAEAGVVAVLLPGTSLYAKIPYTDSKRFTAAGCGVALATDYNPGSCVVDNLPMIMTLGALHCGLSAAGAVAAVTYVAAKALGLEKSKGALVPGYDADLVIHSMADADEFVADLGRTLPEEVWIKGEPLTF